LHGFPFLVKMKLLPERVTERAVDGSTVREIFSPIGSFEIPSYFVTLQVESAFTSTLTVRTICSDCFTVAGRASESTPLRSWYLGVWKPS
jgi:hypothetical protein